MAQAPQATNSQKQLDLMLWKRRLQLLSDQTMARMKQIVSHSRCIVALLPGPQDKCISTSDTLQHCSNVY